MVNWRHLAAVASCGAVMGCTAPETPPSLLLEVIQVQGFNSSDPSACTDQDVPKTREQIAQFFDRAKIVTAKDIHDDYQYAPCFAFGSASRASQSCNWKIQAGMTAEVRCGDEVWLMACGDCEDLF